MLNFLLCFIALVIVLCVILNNASQKIGMPMLLAFIVLGIVLGNFGPHPVLPCSKSRAARTTRSHTCSR